MRVPALALSTLLVACAASPSRDDASLIECKNSVPIDYQYVPLSKAEKDELTTGIKKYLDGIHQAKRMSARNYWLFETPGKEALICEVWRDKRRYRSCTPDMWRLPNKSRKIDLPDIEGVCAVS